MNVEITREAEQSSLINERDLRIETWTVAYAAYVLRRPSRSVRRLLQRGAIKGFKVQGRFGDEWRVEPFDPEVLTRRLNGDIAESPRELGHLHDLRHVQDAEYTRDEAPDNCPTGWRIQLTRESCQKLEYSNMNAWQRMIGAFRAFFQILLQR